jgi:uncharacterized protein YndB with AHSA1/START domain
MSKAAAKAIHGSFTIDRVFDASPARVFKAFADPSAKARWFQGPPGWQAVKREFDFRPGGQEILHGKFPNGMETLFVCRYHEIVPDERLVYVYDMHVNGEYMSVSLATIELAADGAKTKLQFTEQAVYVDGKDGNESRRQGTAALFDRIAENLPD